MPPTESHTMYKILFRDYNNQPHWLETIDPAKIGPWLAEMFMLWPYRVDMSVGVQVETYQIRS